jgi:predicted Zn finger-like uncharacterized protein
MSYITICPACGTAFRLSGEQLQARQGFVRCGQCSKVFDARASLIDASSEEERIASEPLTELSIEPVPADRAVDARPVTQETKHASPPLSPAITKIEVASDAESSEPLPFGPTQQRARRVAALWWGLASALLLAILAAQISYFYRADLVVQLPATKPGLERLCAWLRCTIPAPRHVRLLSIESSELQFEKRIAGLLTLNAMLRNRATYAQAFPALELTLTDTEDRPIARRVLVPQEYLGPSQETTFAANSERLLSLQIDASALRAAGYRLYLFYPER